MSQFAPLQYTPIPRWRSFLDSVEMIGNPIKVFSKYSSTDKDTFSFYFGGLKKAIVTTNPAIVQHVLKTNAKNYNKSDIQVKRMAHFLGKGLLTSHGEEWLEKRRLIQKGFHKDRLQELVITMQKDLKSSLVELDRTIEDGPIDIYQQMMKITFKMVANGLFGIALTNDELYKISDSILLLQQFMVKQIVQPYLNPWFRISGKLRHFEQLRFQADNIILQHIKKRRLSNVVKNDMLQIFFDVKLDGHDDIGMSDHEILSECMQLLVAGHETSSNALSWIFYLMCRNPEVLTMVKKEISNELGDGNFTFSSIERLKYTTQVIEESLRLYPPFWMVDRTALEDDEVDGFRIEKGSTVIVFIYGLHHSKKYWENAEKFDPLRFTPERKASQNPYSFVPFGAGPRGCIGGNFAMMQMLLILSHILQNYDIILDPDEEVEIAPMMILRPKDGIRIKLSKK